MWRHVTAGDAVRFQQPLENAKRDAANSEQQRQQGDTNARPDRRREHDIVRIHNLSGVDLERGDIIGLGDPVLDPGEALDAWWHRPVFVGQLPQWLPQWTHPGRFAILLEPCAKTKVASAVVSGCTHAKVLIRDLNHEYADVNWTGGGIRLTSTDAGSAAVQILAIRDSESPSGTCGGGTEEKWAYVRIQNGGQFTLVGKVVDAPIAAFLCGGVQPPQGKVQVYWLDVATGQLNAVMDRQGSPIYACPYNWACTPIAVDDWTLIHCDRWLVWWATPQQPVTAMLRAYECIQPGETGKKAFVMRQSAGGTGYELDPAYADKVDVDNSDCLIFAVPGDLFLARRDGCCQPMWTPAGEFGLTRRVRVDACLDCDAKGAATVLASNCASADCGSADTACTIQVCNTSGRPIAPCGPEEAFAFLRPKNGVAGTDCCWSLQAGPFPTRAKATLSGTLCPEDESVGVTGVSFPSFCGTAWPLPPTAKNPYGLAGCNGRAVEMVPSFTGCTCDWEIVQVQPQLISEIQNDIRMDCGESSCKIEKKPLKNVLVWSCDDTVCSEATWETVATGEYVTFVNVLTCEPGEDGECGSVTSTTQTGCVFCAGVPVTDDLFSIRTITYVDGLEPDSESECKTRATRKSACVLACGALTENPDPVLVTTSGAKIEAGECIEVETSTDVDGCEMTTVNNTMSVVGGDGVTVQKSGCVYSVSLAGQTADPKTTLHLLCGVEISPISISCVETSGGWTFQVSGGEVSELFTDVTLPASLIEYTSDCGSSGSTPPPPPPPPEGECVTINGINCAGPTGFPYVSWTFNCWPEGAVSMEIESIGSLGSTAIIGPFDATGVAVGQEYWGALADQFGPVNPGESFTFVVTFRDASGNVVSQVTWDDDYDCPE